VNNAAQKNNILATFNAEGSLSVMKNSHLYPKTRSFSTASRKFTAEKDSK